ncbi:MAG TPA: hypothetical protein P5159_24620 [Phycisphaerae bacterium]|nr:hypothetical protein [Phycisphaerae bacterium]
MTKLMGKILVLILVVGAAVWWSCSRENDRLACSGQSARPGGAAPPAIEIDEVEPVASPRPLASKETPYHGLSIQLHSSDNCVKRMRRLLAEIADMGADTVLISTPGYQEHAGSETFKIDPAVTPSEEQWLEIFREAHDRGLRVILMPIILLSDPRGNEWRGVISPPNWDDWFDRYRDFVVHFARIAQRGKVEVFLVGSELISTEKYTDRWRALIKEVRKVYEGRLSYSANWDHYKVVEFWDALDLVGMTNYYKLSDDPNPTQESLIEAWKPIKRGILRWQSKIGKPLMFTEAGWCSQEGTSIEPWNYYHNQKATPAGLEEQRRCYRAFIETWSGTPEVGGIMWWEWNDTAGGTSDYNYTPRGKPAEQELRDWFRRLRQEGKVAADGAQPPLGSPLPGRALRP